MGHFYVKIKTLNGQELLANIAIYLESRVKFNFEEQDNPLLPIRIYSDVKSKSLDIFKKAFPDLALGSISISMVSKDLESLKVQLLTPDAEDLINAVKMLVINDVSESIGMDKNLSFDEKVNQLPKHMREFKTSYLKSNPIDNKKLIRVSQLIIEKEYSVANELLKEIDKQGLSQLEIEEYDFVWFQLLVKNLREDVPELFKDLLDVYSENHRQLKRLYFEYIRFLENLRDDRKPRNFLREFEDIFPLSSLSKSEKSWYFYLKGRAEYSRGDFLFALENLSLALENADKNDERLIASIYNTTVNSFTDNLFFDEANHIAQKAFDLRKKNEYSELYETVSLQGGIKLKSGEYKKALEYFLKSEKMFEGKTSTNANPSRLFNYIAKSAIFVEDFKLAEQYIEKAKNSDDTKGFSIAIELLLNLKQHNYAHMSELFKSSIMLPENQKVYDNFAIGWGYVYMALASFEQKKFKDGAHHLARSISNFQDDMYIFEAFYVSLYLYQYSVPSKEIQRFRDLTKDYYLMDDYEEFIEKHVDVSERYAGGFGFDLPKTNLLKQFYEDTRDMNDENYNPEVVKDILDSFCLM